MKKFIYICLIFLSFNFAQRVKDISYFKGIQGEELIGYGLVTGLAGTGDSHRTSFTMQSVISMMKRFGINAPETNLRTRNVAAVIVTARINNFLKKGGEFDVIISSIGDATSLMGGTLLLTPLSNKFGDMMALAQGPVSIGGYDINTKSGGRLAKNHSLTGRIPSGGIMEMQMATLPLRNDTLTIVLREPDLSTSNNVATVINEQLGGNIAKANDATEINVSVPDDKKENLIGFMANVESLIVNKDSKAKVVLNERTGTIVAGSTVRILPVTISHGSLNISIKSYPIISQPSPLSQGQTVVFNNLVPSVEEEKSNVISLQGATNVEEVARALNELKIAPRDIISVFQALKEAGALIADLIII